ncbi:MAG TPA: NUDIX domain-containing protein [Tepidisphaeraceae bacterium]|nr:NUDIX domain-containing protein [Tepidisphaeraceae bacterium]
MPLSNLIIAVYVVRPAAGKSHDFLQLRRREGVYMAGTWSTVYGSVEPGETAPMAALRELREEAGISAAEFYRLPTARSFYTPHNDTTYVVPGFCAMVPHDVSVALNMEHTDYRWVRRDRSNGAWLWPTDRAAIDEIVNEILPTDSPVRRFLRIDLPL